MKIKHGFLLTAAALAMFSVGCDDEEAASTAGTLVLSVEFAPEITGVTRVVIQSALADGDGNFAPAAASGDTEVAPTVAELESMDSATLNHVLEDVAAGTYRVTASGYVGDASQPAASASVDVTLEANATAVAAILLGGSSDLAIAGIEASDATPQAGQTIDLTATLTGTGVLQWSDNCDGDFVSNGAATVQWRKAAGASCTITLSATNDTTAATATLAVAVSAAKGSIVRVAGSGACYATVDYETNSDGNSLDVWNNHGQALVGGESAFDIAFTKLNGLTWDNSGNLVFPERNGQRVWKYSPANGALTRLAGPIDPARSVYYNSGNGGPALDATFEYPFGVAVEPGTGNIYVSDIWDRTTRIIYAADMTIDAVAGNGGCCSQPTNGVLAQNTQFYGIIGMDFDADGNLLAGGTEYYQGYLATVYADTQTAYVLSDENDWNDWWDIAYYNNMVYGVGRHHHSVVSFNLQTGEFRQVAGAWYDGWHRMGFSGDGGLAYNAELYSPRGIYADKGNGDIYIADSGNHRIRKITQAGYISTVAEIQGTAGDLVLDAERNFYYTDRDTCSVMKVQGPY